MGQGLITQDVIKQIKDRTDITEVVSGYVTLIRSGQSFKGLCPFHAEKTPSFIVNPSRQIFHCFGCGEGGDVIAFFMKRENLGFAESVRELGRLAGVPVPLSFGGTVSQQGVAKERILKVNQSASVWFRRNLMDPRVGGNGREYLASRGITSQSSETFGIGLSLPSWNGLIRALEQEGYTPGDLVSAGLAAVKDGESRQVQDDTNYYDRFRGRVMFPIYDLRGQVIAFGGRVLGDGMPKYLNTPDTALFKKGTSLFGLERAREASWKTHTMVVVEGYFDAVALFQAGIQNVVATLGTALTPDHVRTLRRFADKVVLLFDPDEAGVRAAVRTLDLFRDSGIGVRVVSLPGGDDPDTFVRREGPEAFGELEAQAPTLVAFAVEQNLRKAASGTIEDRIRSVDDILRILQKTGNRIEKEECLRLVAERLGISQKILIERYPELLSKEERGNRRSAGRVVAKTGRKKENAEEREIVRLLVQGTLAPHHIRALDIEAFSTPVFRRIVERSLGHLDSQGRVLVRELLDEVLEDPECRTVATELSLMEEPYENLEEHFSGCLEALERKRRYLHLGELIMKLRTAEREGRVEEAQRLNGLVNDLRFQKAVGALRPV